MDQDGEVCKFFSDASVQLPVDRDRTWIAGGLALPHNRAMFFRTSWKSPTARNVLVFIGILPFASMGSRSAFARDAGVTSEAVRSVVELGAGSTSGLTQERGRVCHPPRRLD